MSQHDPWRFASRRSPVLSTKGMCSSSQPLATQIGVGILDAGGNCVDACVAMAAALNVTEPCSTGIGGDCFALFYNAAERRVRGMNGSGRSPALLDLPRALADVGSHEHGLESLPAAHIHTVTVPGAAAGWEDAVAAWGRLPLARVLAPSIELAERGFPVSPITAHSWHAGIAQLETGPHGHEMLVRVSGSPLDGTDAANAASTSRRFPSHRAPRAGEVFRNPNLARTLRLVAEHGASKGFYTGETGAAIVELVQSLGGVLSADDLAAHRSDFVDPISAVYRGIEVHEIPPNGQGITALLALNILQETLPPLASLEFGSPEHMHRLIQCMRLAFADTRHYVADPAHSQVPVAEMLSREYAQSRAALINADPARAFAVERGYPVSSSDTVSFCAVDAEGNACSFINSNYMGFGSGLVPRGGGFTLQNRGANFSLVSGHPNCLAAGKRPYHTIIPGMCTRNGRLWAPFSVMGGFMQPQGHVQVLTNMIDFGLDPQSALDAPRFCIGDGTANGVVSLEDGVAVPTCDALAAMGHAVVNARVPVTGHARALFGRGQIIRVLHRDEEAGGVEEASGDAWAAVLWAGSDGRGDGCAMPQV